MKRGSVFVDPIHVDKEEKVPVDVVLSTSGEFRGTAELSCKDGSIKFCTSIIDIGANVASDASDAVAVGSAVTNNGGNHCILYYKGVLDDEIQLHP